MQGNASSCSPGIASMIIYIFVETKDLYTIIIIMYTSIKGI